MAEIGGMVITKEIAKSLEGVFSKLNKFVNEEASDFNRNLSSLGEFSSDLNPLSAAFQNVLLQLKSGTLEGTMELMKEALEMAQNPIVNNGLKLIGKIISEIFDKITAGLKETTDGLNKFKTIGEFIHAFFKDPWGTIQDLWKVLTELGDE